MYTDIVFAWFMILQEAVEVGSSPDNKLAEEERGQAGRE